MRIIVNHLTRMRDSRICVAGIDPQTKRHVRPTTGPDEPLTRKLLTEEGGTLALGALVELGQVTAKPQPPETEDHLFRPFALQALGRTSPMRYLELLRSHARDDLAAIFGDALVRHGRTYAVDVDRGAASLGVLRARRKPDLQIEERYGKPSLRLRLRSSNGERFASVPVTDVRFVESDHTTIREDAVADAGARMRRGVDVLLMLGLSRAYLKPGDDRPRHWLQVNGVCMTDRPLAELP